MTNASQNKAGIVFRALTLVSMGLLVAIFFSPIWWVSLKAPNYPPQTFPDGVRIHFHVNGVFNGCQTRESDEVHVEEALDCVHEMNTINHFIGMQPMDVASAMLAFAETLLARSKGKSNVIALGDYNLRENEDAYQMINGAYTNAWIQVYPSGISDEGEDMSGTKRIDHIFISPHLSVRNPVYLLAPESATDHPAHWAEVYWAE